MVSSGGAAFPSCVPGRYNNTGMFLRDYFAAQALQGLLAHDCGKAKQFPQTREGFAERAYEYADAMLKAREK